MAFPVILNAVKNLPVFTLASCPRDPSATPQDDRGKKRDPSALPQDDRGKNEILRLRLRMTEGRTRSFASLRMTVEKQDDSNKWMTEKKQAKYLPAS